MTATPPPSNNGSSHSSRADSRFFCNRARTASLVLGLVAVVALVAGAVLAELSSSGAPTSTQTAAIRWVILAAVVGAVAAYVVGGHQKARDG